jgi:hypothetical protein
MNTYYEEKFDLDKFLDEELGKVKLTKKGQLRKRKPKEPRIYFTQDTEDAIIEYLITEDDIKRNRIYNDRIQYAFYKLSENIIHTFKFYYTDSDTIEDLKHEVITFLLEKLHLYHHSKNINDRLRKLIIGEYNEEYKLDSFIEYTDNSPVVTQQQINSFINTLSISNNCKNELLKMTPPKAYSYFGTIAKRYLIIYNQKNYEKLKDKATIEEIDEDPIILNDIIRKATDETNPEDFMSLYIKYVDKHINKLFPKTQDLKTADAIMELFRKRESIEMFNKKALYIYIREITDATTPQITKTTKKLKTLYVKLYNEYYKNGFIKG